jgi:hypothetical protein
MPGGPGDGSPRRPRVGRLRRHAIDAPVCGGERGLGQGALVVGGYSTRAVSTLAVKGYPGSSEDHRVSPVKDEAYTYLRDSNLYTALDFSVHRSGCLTG